MVDKKIYFDKEQMKPLMDCIEKGSTGFNKFDVFTYETASGKTACIKYMAKKVKYKRKLIIVTKFIVEALNIAHSIGKDAIFYTSDDKYCNIKDINELRNYKVIIITHALYALICNRPKEKRYAELRDIFTAYDTLIIDEEFDVVMNTQVSISKKDITDMLARLKGNITLTNLYMKYVEPIEKVLEVNKKSNKIQRINAMNKKAIENFDDDLNTLMKGVKKYLSSESIKNDIYIENNDLEDKQMSILQYEISKVKAFYDNDNILYYRNGLYTYNNKFEFFTLNNNILLDASAEFNSVYELSKKYVTSKIKFNIIHSRRIIDHVNCKMVIHYYNSHRSSKNKDLDGYRNMIVEDIKSNCGQEDGTLLISYKAESRYFEESIFPKLAKENWNIDLLSATNFYAMRGKNNYSDYKNCYIIQTPVEIYPHYVFRFEYYSNIRLSEEDIMIVTKSKNKDGQTSGFKLEELNQLYIDCMASDIYQGLKRVQRNQSPEALFKIWTMDRIVMLTVIKQLYGLKNIKIIQDKTDKDKKLKEDEKLKAFHILYNEIIENKHHEKAVADKTYTKQWIAEKINYNNNKGHFKRDILNPLKKYYFDNGLIEENKYNLKFNY